MIYPIHLRLLIKERKNSQNPAATQKSVTEAEKPVASNEKVARTGEYVLIVPYVTSPPFMDCRLEPAFLLMKLKIIVKNPK
ncbi:hypothetical protein RRG08_004512 [Elysia crispata]|uniref:Uncharacterized protein n=1 Tax=Elysia crispata TaxID=231223 RepID=A0AAE1B9V0_9GAST|nr:hypothetical protein RRG08_004512 [Elysia crispata]